MKAKSLLFVFVFTLFAATGESPCGAADYPWKASVARRDITPEENVWMAGYAARKGPSEKVQQRIFAKALALEDADGGRLVCITMDLIGVPKDLRLAVEKHAGESHSLPPGSLVINASHTHCGPMIRLYRKPGSDTLLAPYPKVPDDQQELRVKQTTAYRSRLQEALCELIDETLGKFEPATLQFSKAKCGFAMNRRSPLPNGDWKNSPNPDAPVDHEVPVLQILDAEDNLKCLIFGYACHATTLSVMEINGDWPGYAQHYFEAEHPGTTAMFLNGASADQNPYPRRLQHYVERHGQSMATAIEAALGTTPIPISGPIKAAIAWPEINYQDPPSRRDLEANANSSDTSDARHAQFLLEVLDVTGTLPGSYPVPVQVVRFGDSLTLITMGGEVVVDYALRLKQEIGEKTSGAPVWFSGYCNDVMTYIPSRRVLEEGGYEGGGAMRHIRSTVHPAPWEFEIEEKLVSKIHELFESE